MRKKYLNNLRKALFENAASVRASMSLCARIRTALFIAVCWCCGMSTVVQKASFKQLAELA